MPFICRPKPGEPPKSEAQILKDNPPGEYAGTRYGVNDPALKAVHPTFASDLAGSICAFVPEAVLVSRMNQNRRVVRIHPSQPSLEKVVRTSLATATDNKIKTLKQLCLWNVDDHDMDDLKLKSMPWPVAPNLREVNMPFKDELCAATGTGFYTGKGLVLTAGHIARSLVNEWPRSNFKAVFGLTSMTADLSFDQVYDVMGITLCQEPKNISYPRDMYNQIGPLVQEFQERDYDMAIIEVKPYLRGDINIKALKLSPYLPLKGTNVYLSGHPHGISQKVSWGGQILKTPDKGSPNKGTFVADLDAFAGNSGGPVMTAQADKNQPKDVVIGVVTGGSSDTFLPFASESELSKSVKAFVAAKGYQTVINDGWVDFWSYMECYMKNGQLAVAWQRLYNQSPMIEHEVFTRTDPYSYFVAPVLDFLTKSSAPQTRPYGTVNMKTVVKFESWPDDNSVPTMDIVAEKVYDMEQGFVRTKNIQGRSPMDPNFEMTNQSLEVLVVWQHSGLRCPSGSVADWRVIRVKRSGPQFDGTVIGITTVSYEIGNESADLWTKGAAFKFECHLVFKQVQNGVWEALVGLHRDEVKTGSKTTTYHRGSKRSVWRGPELSIPMITGGDLNLEDGNDIFKDFEDM